PPAMGFPHVRRSHRPTAFAQQDEIVELADPAAIADSPYHNPDFAPVPRTQRKWGTWDIAALWISMSACVTTYTLGAGYISRGMNWWEAVLTVFLGNLIVLVPMVLNA